MVSTIKLGGRLTNQLIMARVEDVINNIVVIKTPFDVVMNTKYPNTARLIIKIDEKFYGLDYINHDHRMFYADEELLFREVEMILLDGVQKWDYLSATQEELDTVTYWENSFYFYPA